MRFCVQVSACQYEWVVPVFENLCCECNGNLLIIVLKCICPSICTYCMHIFINLFIQAQRGQSLHPIPQLGAHVAAQRKPRRQQVGHL